MAYQTREGLPNGWVAQWDERYKCYFYVNESDPKAKPQWECPVRGLTIPPPPSVDHSAPPSGPPPSYSNSAAPATPASSAAPAPAASQNRAYGAAPQPYPPQGGYPQQPYYYPNQPNYYPAQPAYAQPVYAQPATSARRGRSGVLSNPMVTGLGGLLVGGLAMHEMDEAFDRPEEVVYVDDNNYNNFDDYGGNDFGNDFF